LEPGGDLDQLLAQGEDLVDGALAAHRSAVLANLIAEQPHRPLADIKDEFEPWFLEQSFYDDNTGKPLPSKGVIEARYEELQVIKQMGVWADFFAAMPPLSAMKALLALATTARKLQPMPKTGS
jgi:hypothetical protein